MSDKKIIVDLSCGGYIDPTTKEPISWLSSNVIHMFENHPELLAMAPSFTGNPHGHYYGSSFIEGTYEELEKFFTMFLVEYDEDFTKREVAEILEQARQGISLIRCYRIVWPDRYTHERPDSQMLARAVQVISHEDRGAGWGHLVSARNQMRVNGLWEVVEFIPVDTCLHLKFLNGFDVALSYYEIGFDFNEDEEAEQSPEPKGDDLDRLMACLQKVADRFDEKIAWFDGMIKADPRYKTK